MKLDLEAVINTDQYIGQKVYICAYQPGRYAKPLQNIIATECIVTTIDEYMANSEKKKPIYYSKNAIIKMHKKQNRPLYNSPIQPYDQTSYKWMKNGAIHVFDNMIECQEYFKHLLKS